MAIGRQQCQRGQFCPPSMMSILSTPSMPSNTRRHQAAWQQSGHRQRKLPLDDARAFCEGHRVASRACDKSDAARAKTCDKNDAAGSTQEARKERFGQGKRRRNKRFSPVIVRHPSGWGGIRTPGSLTTTPVFKTGALNRSATHPDQCFYWVFAESNPNPNSKYPYHTQMRSTSSLTQDPSMV